MSGSRYSSSSRADSAGYSASVSSYSSGSTYGAATYGYGNAYATAGYDAGAYGNAYATAGYSAGAYGNAYATAGYGAGVYGNAYATAGYSAGAYYGNAYATAGYGAGVYGNAYATAGYGVGVYGNAYATAGYSGGPYGYGNVYATAYGSAHGEGGGGRTDASSSSAYRSHHETGRTMNSDEKGRTPYPIYTSSSSLSSTGTSQHPSSPAALSETVSNPLTYSINVIQSAQTLEDFRRTDTVEYKNLQMMIFNKDKEQGISTSQRYLIDTSPDSLKFATSFGNQLMSNEKIRTAYLKIATRRKTYSPMCISITACQLDSQLTYYISTSSLSDRTLSLRRQIKSFVNDFSITNPGVRIEFIDNFDSRYLIDRAKVRKLKCGDEKACAEAQTIPKLHSLIKSHGPAFKILSNINAQFYPDGIPFTPRDSNECIVRLPCGLHMASIGPCQNCKKNKNIMRSLFGDGLERYSITNGSSSSTPIPASLRDMSSARSEAKTEEKLTSGSEASSASSTPPNASRTSTAVISSLVSAASSTPPSTSSPSTAERPSSGNAASSTTPVIPATSTATSLTALLQTPTVTETKTPTGNTVSSSSSASPSSAVSGSHTLAPFFSSKMNTSSASSSPSVPTKQISSTSQVREDTDEFTYSPLGVRNRKRKNVALTTPEVTSEPNQTSSDKLRKLR